MGLHPLGVTLSLGQRGKARHHFAGLDADDTVAAGWQGVDFVPVVDDNDFGLQGFPFLMDPLSDPATFARSCTYCIDLFDFVND